MQDYKPISTPFPTNVKLSSKMSHSSEKQRIEMSRVSYASAVGSLMFAVICTRPDIAYAIGVVSRYMAELGNRVLTVKGYVDSDYAGDLYESKSTTGYVFTLSGETVSWVSKMQSVVAMSTTKAEYVAAAQASKEAWPDEAVIRFDEFATCFRPLEHEVEKTSAFTFELLAIKVESQGELEDITLVLLTKVTEALCSNEPEHQHLIVDAGALPHLVALLKRHMDNQNSRAVNGVIRKAADAITNLVHENGSVKTRVRVEGDIPPLVELLESSDAKVQRAAAGALRTLAFKNDENKTQIVDHNALPTLVLMLQSEDTGIHYEAVGVIGNLVHSSLIIKIDVLNARALQPVIKLLSSTCSESQREAALLLGQFDAADTDSKVHIVQRGAVGPLLEMLKSPEAQLREMSAFALGRLAQDTHNQAGIAHSGGIVPLLKLLDSRNGTMQHNGAFTLYGLADNEDNVADLISLGGVQKLMDGEFIVQVNFLTTDAFLQTVFSNSGLCSKDFEKDGGQDSWKEWLNYLAILLLDVFISLSPGPERTYSMYGRLVLNCLLYKMHNADKIVQRRIVLALAHLCLPEDQEAVFVDNNGLDLLLELLQSVHLKHQGDACAALCRLAEKATSVSPVDAGPSSPISQVRLFCLLIIDCYTSSAWTFSFYWRSKISF
ncbi:ARM repeat protein interacting with ABF2-like protein [Tanacetum coccineum]